MKYAVNCCLTSLVSAFPSTWYRNVMASKYFFHLLYRSFTRSLLLMCGMRVNFPRSRMSAQPVVTPFFSKPFLIILRHVRCPIARPDRCLRAMISVARLENSLIIIFICTTIIGLV